jgi:hypothetical protein
MGYSTQAISVEQARKIIRATRLTRTSYSHGLSARIKPMGAEHGDDGRVILLYDNGMFAEYTKE